MMDDNQNVTTSRLVSIARELARSQRAWDEIPDRCVPNVPSWDEEPRTQDPTPIRRPDGERLSK